MVTSDHKWSWRDNLVNKRPWKVYHACQGFADYRGRWSNVLLCIVFTKYKYRYAQIYAHTNTGIIQIETHTLMIMGNIAPRSGIEPTSFAFWTSVSTITATRDPLIASLYARPPVYEVPCLRSQSSSWPTCVGKQRPAHIIAVHPISSPFRWWPWFSRDLLSFRMLPC